MRRPDPNRRISSTVHYQTFPTPPPRSKGQPPSTASSSNESPLGHARHGSSGSNRDESPLPVKQLFVLAVISLSEQTALNSIGPYLPQMASTFPEVKEGQVGLYVGTIASSFALAQFATNFFWGWLSDRIGRKPVVLTGTLLTAACFVAFGFCRTLWQAILVQVLMGLVNGNQGVVSTCLGEITDRSNQSRAFIYLPVIYGLGGITGPVVGGLLVGKNALPTKDDPYPYLRPNLLSAAVLIVDLIVTMFLLEESLEEAQQLPRLGKRVINLFSWAWQFTSSHRPSYLRLSHHSHGKDVSHTGDSANDCDDFMDDSDDDSTSQPSIHLFPENNTNIIDSKVFNSDTILLLGTYMIFQLSNISYNSLYPIFGQAAPPRGRNLSPEELGVSLAFAGAATIVFQLGIFGRLREKMGNKVTYRVCIAGMALAFILTPWVGYKNIENGDGGMSNGKAWLWIELGFVLLIKSLAAVGCLTSFLLLVRPTISLFPFVHHPCPLLQLYFLNDQSLFTIPTLFFLLAIDRSRLLSSQTQNSVSDEFKPIKITNSAPNHSILGTLNGIAQTLSAAGRAAGPFFAGGLFSLATHVEPKGEALAFGTFGGIAFVGFLLTWGIRGAGLEADGFDSESGEGSDSEDGEVEGMEESPGSR